MCGVTPSPIFLQPEHPRRFCILYTSPEEETPIKPGIHRRNQSLYLPKEFPKLIKNLHVSRVLVFVIEQFSQFGLRQESVRVRQGAL